MPSSDSSSSNETPLNWSAVAAVYAGLSAGIAWLLYAGHYRNAAWLGLIGLGGALTGYGRYLEGRGRGEQARRWQWAGGAFYAVFFVWAGMVLLRIWLGR